MSRHVICYVQGMQSIHADQQDMLDLVAAEFVIAGAHRHNSDKKSKAQRKCSDTFSQEVLLLGWLDPDECQLDDLPYDTIVTKRRTRHGALVNKKKTFFRYQWFSEVFCRRQGHCKTDGVCRNPAPG